jgi:oligopeptide/dipeptide ABC transporter ATP-binding protein
VISLEQVRMEFPLEGGKTLRALDGVTLEVPAGRTLGIVGESGCGKSTLGRVGLGLLKPTRGRVSFAGQDLGALDAEALRKLRRRMQLVFQDPYSSLNPRLRIATQVGEPLEVHWPELNAAERERRVAALLERCGLRPEHGQRFPFELSGGQRQRVAIARSLAVEPELVVADEPVSALDVSVQAQVLNLLVELKRERSLTLVFISHDLKVVRYVSDDVAVMYLGRLVERAPASAVFEGPKHPYTRALLSAIPTGEKPRRRQLLGGEVPSPIAPPSGCVFHPRCPLYATLSSEQQARCRGEAPALRPVGDALVACHFA